MERIGVIINKLQELYQQKAAADQMIHVIQMLHSELLMLKQQEQTPERKKIAVMMPPGGIPVVVSELPSNKRINKSEEVIDAHVDVEDTLQMEKRSWNGGVKEKVTNGPDGFNVLQDVPTLAHQPQVKELNEVIGKTVPSINDRLFEQKTELVERLKDEPLKDIKKAVGVNDRFIFISELFRGDEDMYERSLKTINRFTIFPEAEFWISRELKLKLGWSDDHPAVKQFDQLVRRRFL